MNSSKRILLVILALLPLSCSIPSLMADLPAIPNPVDQAPQFVLAGPDSTATPTPFQPLQPTPTYIPTLNPTPTLEDSPTPEASPEPGNTPGESRTWGDYPGPTVWPDIDIPPPAGILPQPADQVNVLLLGSDQRPYEGGFRTDTILLLTLSPGLGTVSLTSFPRDLYVYIPGYTVQRINIAHAYGGFPMTALTFEYNFGVKPDYYFLINLWSFEEVIDSLGGIDVNVARSLTDHRDKYGQYTIPAGQVHMDGATALWYVRSRYSTSDIDRGRRQEEVMVAAFQKLISLNALSRASELYQSYRNNVITDMSFDEMAKFLPLAAKLTDTGNIHRYSLGAGQVVNWVNYNGAQVLLPLREPILAVMRQALNSP